MVPSDESIFDNDVGRREASNSRFLRSATE